MTKLQNNQTFTCFTPEFLERCRNVTNYYEKQYGAWSPKDQLLKMFEEVAEVQKAKSTSELYEETCDVILACVTMFDIMGLPFDRINVNLEKTLQKVEKRITLRRNDKK